MNEKRGSGSRRIVPCEQRSFFTNQLRDWQATRTTSEMLKAVQERNLSTQGRRIGFLEIDMYYIILHYVIHTIYSLSVWKILSGMSKTSIAKVWSGYPRSVSVSIFAEVVSTCSEGLKDNVSYQRIADLIYTSLFRPRIGKFPFLSHFCIFCPHSLVLSNFIVKRRRVNQI